MKYLAHISEDGEREQTYWNIPGMLPGWQGNLLGTFRRNHGVTAAE